MAIYYINPHTTTNGTGTWASPWSLNNATRTGLTDGDEIRIMGVALTSLLTATSYTATVTDNYRLTITAGGGLGGDWAAGDVAYLPAYDTFFRVYSVTANVIALASTTAMLPVMDWSATSVTLRKVNTATYGVSVTSSTLFITGDTSKFDNITVSDCWTSETTRVTDGTVKTLLRSGSTVAVSFFLNALVTDLCSGWVVNCQNTHIICNTASSSSGAVNLITNTKNSTIEINQMYGWGTSATGIHLSISSSRNSADNNTLTIKSYTCPIGIGQQPYRGGSGNTFNFTNFQINGANSYFNNGIPTGGENTINFTNVFLGRSGPFIGAFYVAPFNSKINVSFTGVVDSYNTNDITQVHSSNPTPSTITLGSGLSIYINKRASQVTTIAVGSANIPPSTKTTFVPTIINNSSISITTLATFTTSSFLTNTYSSILPQQYDWSFPYPNSAYTPSGYASAANQTFTYRDGSNPSELLGIFPSENTSIAYENSPLVTTDATVYRTSGPSLKSYLPTRVSTIWYTNSRAVKLIKIPCTDGTSYTITGYIRSNDSAYVNGDCSVHVYLGDVEVDSQIMTTSCVNAWGQFTLTFTATETAEYEFAWKMYYANGDKSYWLDDLTVS